MTFELTSPVFGAGERIPKKYTGEGEDTSPPLEWTDPPEGTLAFALVCDDPDAPVGTWDHWLIWNLSADSRKLPGGVPTQQTLPDFGGARQGDNSWPKIGYGGPMPPPGHGTHHYNFVLYALDTVLDLAPGANKAALQKAMKGHVLAEARLTGTYSR
ncbi:MAG TPA: YbhB/YbcL family Raf kinase inhibitor-like protein [Phycisphaerae bacterium]|nr:YbhB/YbcL family Raf kinase inhibitor-like protein [Phycisphaerae bacterium]